MNPTYEAVCEKYGIPPETGRTTPFNPDMENVDNPLLFNVNVDDSPSMEGIRRETALSVNGILMPGLRGLDSARVNAIRVGLARFGTTRQPVFKGFMSLEEVGNTPLQPDEPRDPGLGDGTALYEDVICAALWTERHLKQVDRDLRGKGESRGIVVVLTDFADTRSSITPATVAEHIDRINADIHDLVTPYLVYLKTDNTVSESQFEELAVAMRCKSLGYYDVIGDGDPKEQARLLRRAFGILTGDLMKGVGNRAA